LCLRLGSVFFYLVRVWESGLHALMLTRTWLRVVFKEPQVRQVQAYKAAMRLAKGKVRLI